MSTPTMSTEEYIKALVNTNEQLRLEVCKTNTMRQVLDAAVDELQARVKELEATVEDERKARSFRVRQQLIAERDALALRVKELEAANAVNQLSEDLRANLHFLAEGKTIALENLKEAMEALSAMRAERDALAAEYAEFAKQVDALTMQSQADHDALAAKLAAVEAITAVGANGYECPDIVPADDPHAVQRPSPRPTNKVVDNLSVIDDTPLMTTQHASFLAARIMFPMANDLAIRTAYSVNASVTK